MAGGTAGDGEVSIHGGATTINQYLARPRPIPPARTARPQKIKGISIFVDCWYSG
jgi:hypothetical protein